MDGAEIIPPFLQRSAEVRSAKVWKPVPAWAGFRQKKATNDDALDVRSYHFG
jgi:hypothetical protein